MKSPFTRFTFNSPMHNINLQRYTVSWAGAISFQEQVIFVASMNAKNALQWKWCLMLDFGPMRFYFSSMQNQLNNKMSWNLCLIKTKPHIYMVKTVNLVRTQCYLWRHIVVVKLNMLHLSLTFRKNGQLHVVWKIKKKKKRDKCAYLHLERHQEKKDEMTFREKFL